MKNSIHIVPCHEQSFTQTLTVKTPIIWQYSTILKGRGEGKHSVKNTKIKFWHYIYEGHYDDRDYRSKLDHVCLIRF